MPQIIYETSPGGNIGAAFGTGLGQGLQLLAQQKLQNILAEKQRQSSVAGLNALKFTPEEAQAYSYLDPQIQQTLIKNKLNQPNEEALAKAYQKLLGGHEPGVPEGIEQQQQPGFEATPERLTSKQFEKLAPLILKKQQHQEKMRESAFKETKKERNKIQEAAKDARENNMRLARMKELNEKGSGLNPLWDAFLKKTGLDVSVLRSADAQEFEKLSLDFLKNAKSIFGARITDADLKAFMKTVPSLEQTQEGRNRVIRNLELFNKGALVREKAFRDILKEHNNIPPYDLQEKIEERVSPELDKISQEFARGAAASGNALSVGSKFDKLPSPKSLPVGAQLRTKDGSIIENTGTKWKKVRS